MNLPAPASAAHRIDTPGKDTGAVGHLPAIARPKGGGAIRGVGEKFAGNPATGSGSMSVPIPLSPGRSDFGPKLALQYDSSSGNGPFGFGWSLSLPNVSRRTAKGVPRYQEADEPDVFVMSGAEDLVPVILPGGALHHDRHTAPGHVIHRYRPRVEGLFARIERWTDTATGEVHWRTTTRENVTTIFGRTPESRVADPAQPDRVFRWLICETHDDKGNAIVFDYAHEDAAGVDLSAGSERTRARGAQRYLKRIRYGNCVSRLIEPDLTNAEWLFEAVFDYGEGHAVDEPYVDGEHRFLRASVTPAHPWHSRPDPFSDCRAGFEIRTHRRCHRVLMFHHFPDLGPGPCLVRSTRFHYDDPPQPFRTVDDELRHPGSTRIGSFLTRVTQAGHVRQQDGRYLTATLPDVEFTYSKAVIDDTLRKLEGSSLENLPEGVGDRAQWADLDGEGAPGLLTRQAGAWHYKPNLGDGRFGPSRAQPTQPSVPDTGHERLMDLSGDGQLDLVSLDGPLPGHYERDGQGGWRSFRPFESLPQMDWNDPNLRLVDLSGDGLADALITHETELVWFRSLGEAGFDVPRAVHHDWTATDGPQLVFADGEGSVFLADMSGDGLTDIVRIGNGRIDYWPSFGHGRFGARVAMDNPPWFDPPGLFDLSRLQLADIDGSGTTDIIYVSGDGVRLYFNLSGNGWSDARRLETFPPVAAAHVAAADLLGNGTACLVWSTALPGAAQRPLRYIDLMGGQKPHLLTGTQNNLGAETRVVYAPSTRFALADKAAGRPWITRLPFPVHVVERVETLDHIGRTRFVSSYTYHHGHFDGEEREFRGFGLVEQTDTEEFAALTADGHMPAANAEHWSHVPQVLTRSFYHTGIDLGGDHVSDYFTGLLGPDDRGEYFREPGLDDDAAKALLLPDTVLPPGLSAEDRREACRALRGSLLRQETYALDGGGQSELPYGVTERNYSVRKLQERGSNPHAVFLVSEREEIGYTYDRAHVRVRDGAIAADPRDPKACDALDPRVAHTITLETDAFGNPLKSVAIGYGRRHADPSLPMTVQAAQARTLVTYNATRMTAPLDTADAWRTPAPFDIRSYELTGFAPTGPGGRFRASDFGEFVPDGAFIPAFDAIVPFEQQPAGGKTLRLLSHKIILYRRDDLTGPLPQGVQGALGLIYDSYTLKLTPGLVKAIFGKRLTDEMLAQSAHVRIDGSGWWAPTGRVFFSPGVGDPPEVELAHARGAFFLPFRARNPFQTDDDTPAESHVRYDAFNLLVAETIDVLGNRLTVGERGPGDDATVTRHGHDYRVLMPRMVMDSNRNRLATAFDALGMVAGSAVMGKPEVAEGDAFADDFQPDLTPAQIAAFAADPRASALGLLRGATTRIVQDVHAFARSRGLPEPRPVFAATLSRETHESDLVPGQTTAIRTALAYSDGFGRAIQTKVPAEPGPVPERGPDGRILLGRDGQPRQTASSARRWTATGWTVFNNKGKPVRQFEPFFTDTHHFEFDLRVGKSPVIFYDPLSRVIGTLFPNRTWNKSVFDPWRAEIWDVSDTVLMDAPPSDPHLGDFFARLPPETYQRGWHAARIGGGLGPHEQDAARKAEISAGTPTVSHMDALGRTVATVAHNRSRTRDGTTETFLASRVTLDVQGNERESHDQRGRLAMRYDYDMTGARIASASMEAGRRWMLADVAGKPAHAWDDRGHALRSAYDVAQRPLATFLRAGDGPEITLSRSAYGEGRPDAHDRNLCGRLVELRDQAGVTLSERYDFKGNALETGRRLVSGWRETVDWSTDPPCEDPIYTTATRYDALDRPVQMIPARGGEDGGYAAVQPLYNEANLLERLDVWLDLPEPPDGLIDAATDPPAPVGVAGIDYDARGQRRRIDYRNGTATLHDYDPETLRLTRLRTLRDGQSIQDLHYSYDPTGNITRIGDEAQPDVFFRNACIQASADYAYDALHRLTEATGREHLGQNGRPIPHSTDDRDRGRLPHPQDGAAMGRYRERYAYDDAGNLTALRHIGLSDPTLGWTRRYYCDEPSQLEPSLPSNRLTRTETGDEIERFGSYDSHGNMLSLPHLDAIAWDHADQLRMTRRQSGGGNEGRTWYVYGADGQRVRKVTEDAEGRIRHERIYLDGFEIYRRHGSDPLTRETLHIMDDKTRIALVETRTEGEEPGVPVRLVRYQVADHLGHSRLELDETARIVSAEEYSPWRSTTWQAVRSQTQTPKRYRAGKERDDETGFYYHGARYYAPWLCRWISADPAGMVDGANLYRFARNDPIGHIDPTGHQGEEIIDDLLTFLHAQSGFETGAERTLSFSSKAASPFGTAAHAKATEVLGRMKSAGFIGADRIYSEVRVINGIVDRIGGTPGGPKGAHNIDILVTKPGEALAKGQSISGGVAARIGDLKYGGGTINPKYGVHGSPLQTITGRTLSSATSAAVAESKALGAVAQPAAAAAKGASSGSLLARVSNVAKGLSQAASTGAGALGSGVARVAKAAAPLAGALAPVARVAGKIAGPVGILLGVGQMATAENSEEFVDGTITATSSALMMAPHPVAKAAGGGMMAGQLIDKATGASDIASDFGLSVKGGLEDLGVNDTAALVVGGVATVAATPSSITIGAAKTVHHRLTSDEYTLVPWKSQIWSDVFD